VPAMKDAPGRGVFYSGAAQPRMTRTRPRRGRRSTRSAERGSSVANRTNAALPLPPMLLAVLPSDTGTQAKVRIIEDIDGATGLSR